MYKKPATFKQELDVIFLVNKKYRNCKMQKNRSAI